MKDHSDRKNKRPRVVLIGSGRFGRVHLRVLKELHSEGSIEFAGVVVRNAISRASIASEFKVPVFPALTKEILKKVEAVDIVIPPESHYQLVRKCLEYTNVFVEKPLAEKQSEALHLAKLALKYKRILVVGHIFRYHPVVEQLKKLLAKKGLPRQISGSFINPLHSDQGREPSLELLHHFDIVDFLWRPEAKVISVQKDDRISMIDIRYGKHQDARFTLGWKGEKKVRTLSFKYSDLAVEADLTENTIVVNRGNIQSNYHSPLTDEPLRRELSDFFLSLKNPKKRYKNLADAMIGARIVATAERGVVRPKKYPRIAVIGGGIFGTSAAAELGKLGKVTLFERNAKLLQEGSFINQFRHHYGYHYPRSNETVMDIKRSRSDFESVFQKALIHSPTFYGLAKDNSLVSAREFLAFCKKHQLPYKKEFPSKRLLAGEEMALCLKVPEPSYDPKKLRNIIEKRLKGTDRVRILFKSGVTNISLNTDGSKSLTYIKAGRQKKEQFDFVINATYANLNKLTHWLRFDHRPIRIDLAEVLIVRLPINPISLTVIDGPFATLMPTGRKNEFTLYHVKESILDRYVPSNGLIKKRNKTRSNQAAILKESLRYFPILNKAKVLESRIVHRGVEAYHEYDDSRVADLIGHGFGTWSILSGKILSSVRMGKTIAEIIRRSTGSLD